MKAQFNSDDYKSELKAELKMRRNVWKKIPGTDSFVKNQHAFRYRVMAELLELLNVISEREFYVFYGRLQEKGTQTKLNL